jgi:L-2-hydroxyglutarate oxidase
MRGSQPYDILVIGAGIVGLAAARALLIAHPRLRLCVIDKESQVAAHQSGHNSGVVHSGIYYKPGSLKAQLCVSGARQIAHYAKERGIAYERCGKLIVATDSAEAATLHTLAERAEANGVGDVQRVDASQISDFEPHATGVAGLWSPSTGIIDFPAVARGFAADIADIGGDLRLGTKVTRIDWTEADRTFNVETSLGDLVAENIVNCAGLQSDRVARMTGCEPDVRIVPFRGEYYRLADDSRALVRNLIYPVPNAAYPFLGVHLTRGVDCHVEAGPNAVLALSREGYRKSGIASGDIADMLAWPGFRRMVRRHWRTGVSEAARSLSRDRFARSLQKLVPELRPSDLIPGGAGVRAQAVRRDGMLADDFEIVAQPHGVHVLNSPSPAATASLAIADYLLPRIAAAFEL